MAKYLASIVLVGLVAAAGFLWTYFGNLSEKPDFPNEGNLMKSHLKQTSSSSDVSAILPFAPSIMCISASGVDPRYIPQKQLRPDERISIKPSYLEGYLIFLFATNERFYIEKFEHTDISFDELQSDQ